MVAQSESESEPVSETERETEQELDWLLSYKDDFFTHGICDFRLFSAFFCKIVGENCGVNPQSKNNGGESNAGLH